MREWVGKTTMPPSRIPTEQGDLEVSLPLEIRYSQLALHVSLDISGFHAFHALIRRFPWMGLAVTVVLLVIWYQISSRIRAPALEWAWLPILLLGLVLCALQTLLRTDRLTARGIERRSWLLVPRVEVIPYREIQLVKVDEPLFGPLANAGDLRVQVEGDSHLFIGIKNPHEIAAAIDHLRRAT